MSTKVETLKSQMFTKLLRKIVVSLTAAHQALYMYIPSAYYYRIHFSLINLFACFKKIGTFFGGTMRSVAAIHFEIG